MLELFSFGYMQRALAAAVIVGTVCPVIGVYVVLRGLSFIGAGTAHSAFAGVALAYLLGVNPLALAAAFGIGTAWIIHFLYTTGRVKFDVSVGMFYTLMMALAIVFIGLMREYNAEVYGYLFGNILGVTPTDLAVVAVLGSGVLATVVLLFKEFQFVTFDPPTAEAAGLPARGLLFLLLNLIALTIVLSLKPVGALLVFAMVVIPAAAAHQFARTMRGMMALGIAIGVGSSITGLLLSYRFDLPSGALIVIVVAAVFFLSVLVSPKRRPRESALPAP